MRDGVADVSSLEDKVLDHIDERAWLELACELIPAGQPESENPLDPDQPSGREEGIAVLVADKLRQMGFAVEFAAKREGRPNVIGELCGVGHGSTLIVNDHLDTYPQATGAPGRRRMGIRFVPCVMPIGFTRVALRTHAEISPARSWR